MPFSPFTAQVTVEDSYGTDTSQWFDNMDDLMAAVQAAVEAPGRRPESSAFPGERIEMRRVSIYVAPVPELSALARP